MKIYECIYETGTELFKDYFAGESKKNVMDKYGIQEGDIIRIKDVTERFFTLESPELLQETLLSNGWGQAETNLICALLDKHIRMNRR